MSNIRTIKVGTFNLMNFMLPEQPVYGGSLSYSREEYRRKAEWVSFMLDQMDADIIGFQELFHREALLRVIKDHPKYRNARLYMAQEDGEQPSVALLSRYPVEKLEVFTHFPDEAVIDFYPRGRERVALPFNTFTRAVIRADIRIRDYGIISVFVVHLKSKREIFYANEDSLNPVDLARAQSRSLMLRASESVALRALVSKALDIPDRPVILCGDVNDTGNAVTSRIISGEVPQHRLADTVKRRVWELLLYHVKDIQARRSYQDFYYTHIHNGMYESLDHIMVSQELVTEYPRNTGRVGLVSLYNDHLVDQTFTQHGADRCKSDHGIVVCSLELDLDRAQRFMRDHAVEVLARDGDQRAEAALNQLSAKSMSETASDRFNPHASLDRWRRQHSEHSFGVAKADTKHKRLHVARNDPKTHEHSSKSDASFSKNTDENLKTKNTRRHKFENQNNNALKIRDTKTPHVIPPKKELEKQVSSKHSNNDKELWVTDRKREESSKKNIKDTNYFVKNVEKDNASLRLEKTLEPSKPMMPEERGENTIVELPETKPKRKLFRPKKSV